jgi:phosphatidylethanolamine-binding protein (PEBP) family uncharacterized protein
MAFMVTSNSFEDGDYLPKDFILSADFGFGCAGDNRSPHLKWSDATAGRAHATVSILYGRTSRSAGIFHASPIL